MAPLHAAKFNPCQGAPQRIGTTVPWLIMQRPAQKRWEAAPFNLILLKYGLRLQLWGDMTRGLQASVPQVITEYPLLLTHNMCEDTERSTREGQYASVRPWRNLGGKQAHLLLVNQTDRVSWYVLWFIHHVITVAHVNICIISLKLLTWEIPPSLPLNHGEAECCISWRYWNCTLKE